jgi:hypothetical protein
MQPIIILNASKQAYISIGIKFGGIKLNGVVYIYNPMKDAFIHSKYTKFMRGRTWEEFIDYIKSIEQDATNPDKK